MAQSTLVFPRRRPVLRWTLLSPSSVGGPLTMLESSRTMATVTATF